MYLQNKYTQCYYNIVNRAKARKQIGYVEKHHIIPKSLGGKNTDNNLVKLTAREHFICHWLLTKMLNDGPDKWKLLFAFHSFVRVNKNQNRYKVTGKKYEILKKAVSEAKSKLNIGNKYSLGHKRSTDTISKWKESYAGHTHSNETKQKLSQTMKEKYTKQEYVHKGKTYEDLYGPEEAQRRCNKLKGPRGPRLVKRLMPTLKCPHCSKVGGAGNMKRYHFDNCSAQKGELASQS